jgi:putative ABC transport system ATP-binding protein
VEEGHRIVRVVAMSPTLEAQDLYRFYHAGDDEVLALRGVSVAVDAGELVAVTGPSGSGKSTLLACLAGLDEPDGGMVRVDGEQLSRRSERARAALRARRIGVLFQSANLLDSLTVAENVRLARQLAGRTQGDGTVNELLDELGIGARGRARPSELSGGELARAGLAVAIANNPSVIVADEPTGELDQTTAARLFALLRSRTETGAAVVVVTHSEALAQAADRVITLRDGQVVS